MSPSSQASFRSQFIPYFDKTAKRWPQRCSTSTLRQDWPSYDSLWPLEPGESLGDDIDDWNWVSQQLGYGSPDFWFVDFLSVHLPQIGSEQPSSTGGAGPLNDLHVDTVDTTNGNESSAGPHEIAVGTKSSCRFAANAGCASKSKVDKEPQGGRKTW